MGESRISVLLAATLTMMTMMTKTDSSLVSLSTTARDNIVDSKRVCFLYAYFTDYDMKILHSSFSNTPFSNFSEGGHRGSLGCNRGGIDGFFGRGLCQYGGI